jgi:uridine kinase
MRDGRWVQAREVILLEGIWALYDDALTNIMDLRIYVDTDSDVRILRRLQRDIKDRGRTVDSVVNQYLTSVKPMHEAFVVPSKTKADLVIPGDGTPDALSTVILKIQAYLKIDSAD